VGAEIRDDRAVVLLFECKGFIIEDLSVNMVIGVGFMAKHGVIFDLGLVPQHEAQFGLQEISALFEGETH
jgi:hypothetical protein